MSILIANRVKETSTTTGLGAMALLGAMAGHQSFDVAFPSGSSVRYCIEDGVDWEVGVGIFTSPSTLTRTTVEASSNAGAFVNWGVGTRRVFNVISAAALNNLYERGASWSGGGAAVVVPSDDVSRYISIPGTIKAATILTEGGPGSCVIDVWKSAYGSYPPVLAGSICASAKPTISAGIKARDTTLTGWTTDVAAGDVLRFHLVSSSGFTAVNIFFEIQP